VDIDGDKISYYAHILKKQMLSEKASEQYMNYSFSVATSKAVERVFSQCMQTYP